MGKAQYAHTQHHARTGIRTLICTGIHDNGVEILGKKHARKRKEAAVKR